MALRFPGGEIDLGEFSAKDLSADDMHQLLLFSIARSLKRIATTQEKIVVQLEEAVNTQRWRNN